MIYTVPVLCIVRKRCCYNALKPLIPFLVHGKIDFFNVAYFAVQTLFTHFHKDQRACFNLGFTMLGRYYCFAHRLAWQCKIEQP